MKQKHWILLFLIVLAGDIVGVQLDNTLLQTIFKPMIIPALIGYFDSQAKDITKGVPKWVLLALVFSWAGDVLLMFVTNNENFFLAGLASFLLAHVFYIIFFHQVRIREAVKPNIVWLILVIVYYTGLIIWLSPYLYDMKLPVRVYGLVISCMLMLALHMPGIKNKNAGWWMMAGAVLFVISDSVLAINRFYQPFDAAGVIIMLTYGLAQLFIVKGAANYINASDKE
jgi:uncharacterized membrane protein YhhN